MSSVSRSVGRPVTRSVLAGQLNNLASIIKSAFSKGEQGFAYDPNDLTTLYQDAAGAIPVTAAGQPVGLMLDKSQGLVLGQELFDDTKAVFSIEATRLAAGLYNIKSSGAVSSVTFPLGGAYKYVEVDFEVTRIGSGDIYINPALGATAIISTLGRRKMRFMCYRSGNDISFVRSTRPTDVDFRIHSIREIKGNHAYQTTSSMRPLLVAAPQRLDYDTVDDKLITNLPTQLTGCTVVRSVPNGGTQILTGQTIPATYEDNKDHCGLIVINRALTPSETSAITYKFNKRAGV